MQYGITSGSPIRMGAHHDGEGVNFAVFSANAEKIELCLFGMDGVEEVQRIQLPERSGDVWHGYVSGLPVGTVYGYRAYGAYAPHEGHRFNPSKLLLDPYTRELNGAFINHSAMLGFNEHDPAHDLSFDTRDSAPFVAKSVVSDPMMFPAGQSRLSTPWTETLIYEAHVKGLTQLNDAVPKAERGVYDGLASDAMLEHLNKIGVTAIELLPVHAFLDDAFLLKKGLTNYWGYNTIGYFTPEPRYFGPAGTFGFRRMVERFHEAGIEVLLDVVYNHTAEGDQRGPTLCFRGLDNASYYRLRHDDPRFYVNDTGTGNTLNVAHPNVLRLVMDSLRFWVECMGVDGFRFDLGTTLGREDHGFDPSSGFFDALRQDPLLAGVKLIAEPWDIGPGGYQLGRFPPEFAEWNDKYRDAVRMFWRGDRGTAQALAARLLGSADVFDHSGRSSNASINFLTAHDGFTLADVTSYAARHNADNLEDNRDGHSENHSDNLGVEGPTPDPDIQARRLRRQRNMLATLFLSQGTPMLLAGDELGNSQSGNNNAYCQGNPISWIDWSAQDAGTADFVAYLASFRRAHPALRQKAFLHGEAHAPDGLANVVWSDITGAPPDWSDSELSALCVLYRTPDDAKTPGREDAVLGVFQRSEGEFELALPKPRKGMAWMLGIDSGAKAQEPRLVREESVPMHGPRVLAFFEVELGGPGVE